MEIIWSDLANQNLDSILDYVEDHFGVAVANKSLQKIAKKGEWLAKFPGALRTPPVNFYNFKIILMLDVTAVILTYNEEIHIRRCLERISPVVKQVFLIDCYSTDRTVEIAGEYGNVSVLRHEWPQTKYAGQFNWALENAPIKTEWVLRLDADEYLSGKLVEELKEKLPKVSGAVNGIVLKRRHIFMGKWMKGGIYPVKLLRIFRNKKAICEQRLMDEHIQLLEGESMELEHDFCDENLNDLSWFCHKHVNYATREAVDMLDIELNLTGAAAMDENRKISSQAEAKRMKKHIYAQKPLFWRSFAYFVYRYFVRGAWREGKEGFLFSFLQGWWYRTLVDAKVYEIKKACGLLGVRGSDISERQLDELREYINKHYNMNIKSNRSSLGGVNLKQ